MCKILNNKTIMIQNGKKWRIKREYGESLVLAGVFKFIESILGYKLSAVDRQPFYIFMDFESNLVYFDSGEMIQKKKNIYKFCNRILVDVQNSFHVSFIIIID
jgi:hypothetical protein